MKLDPALRRFFEEASSLRLTNSEKAAMRRELEAHIALGDVHLTADELAEGKDALVTYMRAHPVNDSARFTVFELLHSFFFSRVPALAFSALIVVIGSGAVVASAAEGALPGDALYGVKVDFLEPLRERIIQNPEKRVAWKVRKVERRLMEAQSLQERDRLTESHRDVIEQSITREVRELQDSARWDGEEMIIASQQVLEETMEAVASGDDDKATAHPEWRQWKSFVRERQSDVHRSVRERMKTAYGIDDDAASASVVVPKLIQSSPVPALMAVPAADVPADTAIAAPVKMMRVKDVPSEEDNQRENENRREEGVEESVRNDRENGRRESEERLQPSPESEPLQDIAPQDRSDVRKQGHEDGMERLKEKREHIEKELRGLRTKGELQAR